MLSTLEIISSKKLNLIDHCVSMVKTILLKLQERCPLKYLIVCCSSCLVPRSIVNESESIILRFNKVLDKLFKHQQLNNKEADEAKLQFEEFVMNYVLQHSDKFNSFNESMQHLDKFYSEFLHKNQHYKSTWKVFIFTFTLSHGQSQAERGFSINKEIVIENLHSSSLSAQCIVYDLKASKKNIYDTEITIKKLTSCKSAHSRYLIALEDARQQSQVTEKETKCKLIKTEMEGLKLHHVEVMSSIISLEQDVEKYFDEAEEKHDMSLFLKSNAL